MNKILKEFDKYSGFISNSIKEEFAYKFRALIWSVYSIIFMFIQVFLWKAIFNSNNGSLYDISLNRYISYIGIGLIVGRFTECFQDFFIGEEVMSGNIAMNLVKPYSFRKMVFARHVGGLIGGSLQLIPVILVIIPLGAFKVATLQGSLFFIISLALASVLVFLFVYFAGLLSFWLTNLWGLHLLRNHLKSIFSGELIALPILFKIGREGIKNVPFDFIPVWLIENTFLAIAYISYLLPFQAMFYTPSAIYTGLIVGTNNILLHIGVQLFWILFFYAVTSMMWNKALHKVSIQGG